MADWIRSLFQATGVSREWHARKTGGYSTTTYCDLIVEGPLEIARPDRAEREGRCARCANDIAPALMKPAPRTAAVGAEAAPRRSGPAKRPGQQAKRGRR